MIKVNYDTYTLKVARSLDYLLWLHEGEVTQPNRWALFFRLVLLWVWVIWVLFLSVWLLRFLLNLLRVSWCWIGLLCIIFIVVITIDKLLRCGVFFLFNLIHFSDHVSIFVLVGIYRKLKLALILLVFRFFLNIFLLFLLLETFLLLQGSFSLFFSFDFDIALFLLLGFLLL